MFGLFRAGGFVAAMMTLACLCAAPAAAADAGRLDTATNPLPYHPQAASAVTQFQPQTSAVASQFHAQGAGVETPAAEEPAVADEADALLPVVAPAPTTQASRPLHELVISFVDYGNQDAEQECLAKAVYFEARGESLEGQLAVAQVVMNRAASGIYPPSICEVVTQPAQFSFIRGGEFPPVDKSSDCWHKALAIVDIARKHLAQELDSNVLWYHATYVAPSWGRRLNRVAQIGLHIFYS